jgi:hypothetical protein
MLTVLYTVIVRYVLHAPISATHNYESVFEHTLVTTRRLPEEEPSDSKNVDVKTKNVNINLGNVHFLRGME